LGNDATPFNAVHANTFYAGDVVVEDKLHALPSKLEA
jgi:hypothetical protein